jgi:hypothetical protein
MRYNYKGDQEEGGVLGMPKGVYHTINSYLFPPGYEADLDTFIQKQDEIDAVPLRERVEMGLEDKRSRLLKGGRSRGRRRGRRTRSRKRKGSHRRRK